MKKVFIYLLISTVLITSGGFCKNSSSTINQNPNVSLDPQDVPLFYNNSPLTDLKAFTVIAYFPLKNTNLQKQLEQSIETILGKIGTVIHLQDNDMRGFGTGNVLLLQMGNITASDGSKLPISRFSLSIETPVSIDKTGIKTFPMVWSINTFLQETIDANSETHLTQAIQKLLGEFIQSYQYVNQNQTEKPLFYIYN